MKSMENNGNAHYPHFLFELQPKQSESEWFESVKKEPGYVKAEVEPDDWLEWAATFG